MVISDGQVRVSPFEKPPQENGKYNHHQGAGNHAQPTGVFNAAPVPKKQNGNGNYADDDGAYGDMISRQNALDNRNGKEVGNETCTEYSQQNLNDACNGHAAQESLKTSQLGNGK